MRRPVAVGMLLAMVSCGGAQQTPREVDAGHAVDATDAGDANDAAPETASADAPAEAGIPCYANAPGYPGCPPGWTCSCAVEDGTTWCRCDVPADQ